MDLSLRILLPASHISPTPKMLPVMSFISSITGERSELLISERHMILCGFTTKIQQETLTICKRTLFHLLCHISALQSTWTLTSFQPQKAESLFCEGAAGATPARRLTSSGPGEDFDACGWGTGRGAEDSSEAQATGRLGRGVLMRRIWEDSFGWWGWARLGLNWCRQRTSRQGRAPRGGDPFNRAGRTDAALSLQDEEDAVWHLTPGWMFLFKLSLWLH